MVFSGVYYINIYMYITLFAVMTLNELRMMLHGWQIRLKSIVFCISHTWPVWLSGLNGFGFYSVCSHSLEVEIRVSPLYLSPIFSLFHLTVYHQHCLPTSTAEGKERPQSSGSDSSFWGACSVHSSSSFENKTPF